MHSITIDMRMYHASGIGTYIRNLVPLVITNLPGIKFNLLGDIAELKNMSWPSQSSIHFIQCCAPIYSIQEQIQLKKVIPRDTTLFWSPHFNIPLFYRGKLLVTIHDVFHLAMPRYVKGLHKKLYARIMFGSLNFKASAVICDSFFTMSELRRLVLREPIMVYPIHIGVAEDWFDIPRTKNPYHKPYILFVGNVKPHKNLDALLKAFKLIQEITAHDLIIVGKKEGFITGDRNIIAQASHLAGRVQFIGYVDDGSLKQFYAHADALVLPSFYEGFGLPPVEAMACGCPVIVSNVASLPEICGSAALYVDPYCAEDIADKMIKLLRNLSLREMLRRKGLERAMQFTWKECARQTCEVIDTLLQ